MKYVALLRGINVGGNSRVEMARLKTVLADQGLHDIQTYINSGNVMFSDPRDQDTLCKLIETTIEQTFGFHAPVILRTQAGIHKLVRAIPNTWVNDQIMRTDVMFLWHDYDRSTVLDELKINKAIEDVEYLPGAIVWRIDRVNANKYGALKLMGTPLYKHMTIRNVNTVRKLAELMN